MQVGTPSEVFDKPKNLFVAEFIGAPKMNTFPAKLTLKDGKYYVTAFGATLPVEGEKAKLLKAKVQVPPEGKDIILGVRPEHMELAEKPHPGAIHVSIEVSEMMGSEVHLHVLTADKTPLIVRVATMPLSEEQRAKLNAGNDVDVEFEGKVMLWPLGKLNYVDEHHIREGYENLILFLKAGIKAAREVTPKALLVIHLENSGNLVLHEEFYTQMAKHNLDYDVIGLSYYPYWHGLFPAFFANVENLKAKFHKPIWIVETGYGFTMEPFIFDGGFQDNLISKEFFKKSANVNRPYPLSKEGQKDFVKALLTLSKEHDEIKDLLRDFGFFFAFRQGNFAHFEIGRAEIIVNEIVEGT